MFIHGAFPGSPSPEQEDKTSEVKAKPSPPDFQLLAWFLVSFIVVGILVLLSFFWHRRKKLGLVCKFLSSDYGYQVGIAPLSRDGSV